MGKNQYQLILLLFIAIVTTSSKCRKDEDFIVDYQYNFLEPINLYPYKKTYQIGDTIYLEHFRNEKVLFDELSNREVPIDSVGFQFDFALSGFPKLPTNPTDDYSGLILPNGAVASHDKDRKLTRVSFPSGGCGTNRSNNFKAGIILRKAGIYSLQLPISAYTSGINTCVYIRHDNFRNATLKFKFNLEDCNKDLYLAIPQTYRCDSDSCIKFIDKKEMFVFKVE